MIAANLRKHPDAMIRQLELDLAGVVGADKPQRETFRNWLMNTGKVIVRKIVAPGWWVALQRRAARLAKGIKAALLRLFVTE